MTGKKLSRENIPEEAQKLGLLGKDFKPTITNMLKGGKNKKITSKKHKRNYKNTSPNINRCNNYFFKKNQNQIEINIHQRGSIAEMRLAEETLIQYKIKIIQTEKQK